MAQRLTANVVLRHPETGAQVCLLSGSELPAWAAGRVGGHVIARATDTAQAAPGVAAAQDTERSPARPPAPDPPPRSGKGSSDAAWTAYARSQGVQVSEEMTRREVIEACEQAGVPT